MEEMIPLKGILVTSWEDLVILGVIFLIIII